MKRNWFRQALAGVGIATWLLAWCMVGVSGAFATDDDNPSVQIRVVNNAIQIGSDVFRPYYVEWRTPNTPWRTWNLNTELPPDIGCAWMRGVFEPEEAFSWELPDDLGQVLTPSFAETDPVDGTHWSTIASIEENGAIQGVLQEFVKESVNFLPAPDPLPAAARNNQASATPDPGRVKMFWHNSNTRYVAAWMMSDDGTLKSFGLSNEGGMAAGWDMVGIGDIDRDGVDDLLWHNSTTRKVAYWLMEPDGYIRSSGFVSTNAMVAGWVVRAVGDINKDGTVDIAWHNSQSRRVAYWMLNADGTLNTSGFCNDGGMAAGWELVGSGDIDGDGTMDLLWHNSATRRVAYWFLNADGTLASSGFCNDGGMADGWVMRGTGDVAGDGRVGLYWHNSASTRVAFWILGTDGVLEDFGFCNDGGMAAGWVLSGTGDLNNDGVSDLIWHNSSTRKVAYWLMASDGTLDTSGFSTDLTMSAGWVVKGAGL